MNLRRLTVIEFLKTKKIDSQNAEKLFRIVEFFKSFSKLKLSDKNLVEKHLTKNFDFNYFAILPGASKFSKKFQNFFFEKMAEKDFGRIDDMVTPIYVRLHELHWYLLLMESGAELDERIEKMTYDNCNYFFQNTIRSTIVDKPLSTIDFKRTMVRAYKDQFLQPLEPTLYNATRASLAQMLTRYYFKYKHRIGLDLFDTPLISNSFPTNVSWNDEIRFIFEMKEKIDNGDRTRNEFIDRVARVTLDNLPKKMSDRAGGIINFQANKSDVIKQLKQYQRGSFWPNAINAEEVYRSLNDSLFIALTYFLYEMFVVEEGRKYTVDEFFYDESFDDYKNDRSGFIDYLTLI